MDPVVVEHKHVIIRAEVNNPPKEADQLAMKSWVINLIDRIGMTLLSGPHVEYVNVPGNVGMTTVSIIETSHIAIHVWEEPNPALMQIDIYTCGPLDLDIVWEELQAFEPLRIDYKFLDREYGLESLEEGFQVEGNYSLHKSRSSPAPTVNKSQGITSAHNV
jgi:S-adenosylmethionine/arginine decarboxylase-like enzyme